MKNATLLQCKKNDYIKKQEAIIDVYKKDIGNAIDKIKKLEEECSRENARDLMKKLREQWLFCHSANDFRSEEETEKLENGMMHLLEGMKTKKGRSREEREKRWKELLNKLYDINSLSLELAGLLMDGLNKVDKEIGELINLGKDQAKKERKHDKKARAKFFHESQQKINTNHTKPNQTQPNHAKLNQTKPNQTKKTKPNQPIQTKPNQTHAVSRKLTQIRANSHRFTQTR